MPKFTSPDIPLFKGIIGDLFPGVEVLASDYGSLLTEMHRLTEAAGLQPTDACARAPQPSPVRHRSRQEIE